jgi:CheY-like chemotaxis protein
LKEGSMMYDAFLQNRGSHFRRVAARLGDAVVCTTSFGAIDLTSHVWTLAQGRLERKLVEDIGGYGVMHGRCEIEPLVEFLWKVDRWSELRIMLQFVREAEGRTFVCVQRKAHGWYAVARVNTPGEPLLLKNFFSTRRAHDGEGFGFCASAGLPEKIYNYKPDLLDRDTIVMIYGYWLRWAEKQIRAKALHYGAWPGEVKHGVGTKEAQVAHLRKAVASRIVNRPLTTVAIKANGEARVVPPKPERPAKPEIPKGSSLPELTQWYRDGFEQVLLRRGRALRQEKKHEDAREVVEKLIVVTSDKPENLAEHLVTLGNLDEELKDFEGAAAAYRKAVLLEPSSRRIWYAAHARLAYSLIQLVRFDEAVEFAREAVRIDPSWYTAYTILGQALEEKTEYGEAARMYVAATLLWPRDLQAFHCLEEMVKENDMVRVQMPEIEAELAKCRKAVEEKVAATPGPRTFYPHADVPRDVSGGTGDDPLRRTVAILDDEEAFIDLLGMELAGRGFVVLGFTRKEHFLEKLPELQVDVVISDLVSPGMSGLQFLAEMKRDEKGRKIPVIVVTGSDPNTCTDDSLAGARKLLREAGSEVSGMINAKHAGAVEAFCKPVDIDRLAEAVERWIGTKK